MHVFMCARALLRVCVGACVGAYIRVCACVCVVARTCWRVLENVPCVLVRLRVCLYVY